MSRTIDFDDYTIHDDVFCMLDCDEDPPRVDRFAWQGWIFLQVPEHRLRTLT